MLALSWFAVTKCEISAYLCVVHLCPLFSWLLLELHHAQVRDTPCQLVNRDLLFWTAAQDIKSHLAEGMETHAREFLICTISWKPAHSAKHLK